MELPQTETCSDVLLEGKPKILYVKALPSTTTLFHLKESLEFNQLKALFAKMGTRNGGAWTLPSGSLSRK